MLANSGNFAQLLYQRLFELVPEARAMFGADLRAQGSKLVTMLSTVVLSASNLDALEPQIGDLGQRHRTYGVTPGHYEILKSALLWSLSRQLGAQFDETQRAAWSRLYDCIATRMEAAR